MPMVLKLILCGILSDLLSCLMLLFFVFFTVLVLFVALQCSLLSFGGKVKEDHISLLINAGLLVSYLCILTHPLS